jgi:hypothetical protein
VLIRGEKNIYFPLDKERFVWYTYYSASRRATPSMKDKGGRMNGGKADIWTMNHDSVEGQKKNFSNVPHNAVQIRPEIA